MYTLTLHNISIVVVLILPSLVTVVLSNSNKPFSDNTNACGAERRRLRAGDKECNDDGESSGLSSVGFGVWLESEWVSA